MSQQIKDSLKEQLLSNDFKAAILSYNRLEGRPRKEDFDRSLKAEIRDPLWMLCRQWQFGEFNGEDAGSAVKARVQLDTTRINRYAVRKEGDEGPRINKTWEDAVPYNDQLPLEVEVEREILLEKRSESPVEKMELRILIGRHWIKLLRQVNLVGYKPEFIGKYPFIEVTSQGQEKAQLQSDPAAWQRLKSVLHRLPDGIQLMKDIQSADFDQWVDGNALFDADKPSLKALGRDLEAWFFRLYSQPATKVEDAWEPSSLEYQFALNAPNDESDLGRTMLVAEEYHSGHLDWYAFDVKKNGKLADLGGEAFESSKFKKEEPIAFLPTQIEFNGMPNVRWWEFEDRRINFGNINAETTDVPHMMLAEFGLVYGNDWTVLPYDLEVGSLCEIQGIVVIDVFGVRTFIRPAGFKNEKDLQAWSLYDLNILNGEGELDKRLLLPPAIAKLQESKPIEKVILARDEMANLVWGIEAIIPGISGIGVNGYEIATALSNYFLENNLVDNLNEEEKNAKIRYILGTSVPENWIPFIASKLNLETSYREIRLQRAAMPRLTDNIGDSRVEPRGKILRQGLDEAEKKAYFIYEGEVPRAGIQVTRSFQRTRWIDGKVYTWLGRQKKTGRGEGASGLEFDQISIK